MAASQNAEDERLRPSAKQLSAARLSAIAAPALLSCVLSRQMKPEAASSSAFVSTAAPLSAAPLSTRTAATPAADALAVQSVGVWTPLPAHAALGLTAAAACLAAATARVQAGSRRRAVGRGRRCVRKAGDNDSADAKTWEDFSSWLTDRGGDVSAVTMARPNGIRGLVATRDIKEGETIVEVPLGAVVKLSVGLESSTDPSIAALGLLKVRESGKDDTERDIQPYLDIMPTEDSPEMAVMPDFYAEEDLQKFQHPSLMLKTSRRQQLCAQRAAENNVDVRSVQWAWCTVAQRSFTVESPYEGVMRVLLPAIDLFNHCAESRHKFRAKWQLAGVSDGAFKVVAGSDVKKGEEVTVCYGGDPYRPEGCGGDCHGDVAWTNDQYVQRYGMVDKSMGTMMVDGKWLVSEAAAPVREALQASTASEDETALASGDLTPIERLAVDFRLSLKTALVAQRAAEAAAPAKSQAELQAEEKERQEKEAKDKAAEMAKEQLLEALSERAAGDGK
eukprot:TRINITY_DN92268_c0_g1_i1.p1 TRINITY_DN92268_c0_g1~~TRINITY_DN92268_c0_g1_i1.p1  ORF type:complete len:532 (-),score=139.57 TRINITY_DN92268_c0_g1_i1:330-1844(-)